MTALDFEVLSYDLRRLARDIPLGWGAVQNDDYDKLIRMFDYQSYDSIENAISKFDDRIKQYFRRRWYMWQCSRCDEYLFCLNKNVTHNPNKKDQGWDIKIDGKYQFDIKGTIVPREMRPSIDLVVNNPLPMIEFYYERQSKGVRHCFQNRLFVVHHSFVEPQREFYLRCAWLTKKMAYKDFCETLDNVQLYDYRNCVAAVIFVVEKELGKAEYIIPRVKR